MSRAQSKAARPRRVFGRIEAKLDGHDWHIELTKSGLVVRKKWGHKAKIISPPNLVCLATGQSVLPLE